ncbi:MAG: autotransporter outer membrane beta-barrel domain-containing protein [Acidithiobacillus sp.]
MGTGYLSLNSQRELLPTTLTAGGSSNGWFFGAGTQAQYLIPLGQQTFLMPYGDMSYLHTSMNGFTDHGAGILDLTTAGESTNLGIFTGGVRAGIDVRTVGLTWVPWAEVGGTGYAGTRRLSVLQTTVIGSNLATTRVAPVDSVDAGAGLTLKGSGPWTAKVAYVGQFSSDMHYNTFDLEANYVW